jgi:hypothetical protein
MENAQQCLEELKKDPMYSDRLDKIPEIDTSWMEQTKLRAAARLDSCLAEFKRQRDDAVKESIRRSLDEVFLQYVQMGELNDALKLYGRGVREYCTAPNYFIQVGCIINS